MADPVARGAVAAVRSGDLDRLRTVLRDHPGLAAERLGDDVASRTLLHVLADWPGAPPHGPDVVRMLTEAGADVDARFAGPHRETPLHWAASSGDLPVLDALLDAVAFAQWAAARRLVDRGARVTLWQAAALGLLAHVLSALATTPPPSQQRVTEAFWCACHGGQMDTARALLAGGADRDWLGFDELTPLGAALRSHAEPVARWLRELGAR